MSMYRCAACGSPKVMVDTQSGGVKFNYVKGAVADAIIGPGGAVAGLESNVTQVFICPDCGITLTYPMSQDIKNAIDLGVIDLAARKNLSVHGCHFDWKYLKSQYKNIENGPADDEEQKAIEITEKTLSYFASASKEEFDQAIDTIRAFLTKMDYYGPVGYDSDATPGVTRRFSEQTPPSLAEYIEYLGATRVIIENMSRYLPPPLPEKYRCLRYFEFKGLFFTYIMDALKQSGFSDFDYRDDHHRISHQQQTGKFLEYAITNSLVLSFIKFYMAPEGHYDSDYLFKQSFGGSLLSERNQMDLNGRGFGLETELDTLLDDCGDYSHDWRKVELGTNTIFSSALDDALGIDSGIDSLYIMVPLFTIKDGRLGIWDATFDEYYFSHREYEDYIESYLKSHPTIKEEVEKDLAARKKDIDDALEVKAKKDKLYQEQKKIENEISKLDDKIKVNNYQIQLLQKKIFGKTKAQAEISQLNNSSDEIRQQQEKLKQVIVDLKNDATSITSGKDITSGFEFFQRLVEKYDYFIDWKWVEEEEAPTETDNIDMKTTNNQTSVSGSSASEIREFKQLLDDGIITQEEFDAKKKQLLGL